MASSFDRRVAPEAVLAFVRACQATAPCHLGGGVALAGAHLRHRLSRDVNLLCHDARDVRLLVRDLGRLAGAAGGRHLLLRDEGTFVRAQLALGGLEVGVDLVHEAVPDIEPPPHPSTASSWSRWPTSVRAR